LTAAYQQLEFRGFWGPARTGRRSFGRVCHVTRKPHRKSCGRGRAVSATARTL